MGRWGLLVFLWSVTGFGCVEQPKPEEPTKFGVKDYLARAYATVDTLQVADAIAAGGNTSLVSVDVREGDELIKKGKIPGSVHVPRGVLEFYIDETSSMHMALFSSGKKIVFYCESGARSVLADRLAMNMGLEVAAYLGGGFTAWVIGGGTVEHLGKI